MTIIPEGDGHGVADVSPVGINCGTSCTACLAPGTVVTLRGWGGEGSAFAGWREYGCWGAEPCTVEMNMSRTIYARFTAYRNIIFSTSTLHRGHEIGGLAGADALCNSLARTAGLYDNFRAWLSDEQTDARERFSGVRGWVRTDGRPFADTLEDLLAGRIYHPPRLDERGNDLGRYQDSGAVFTGTTGNGLRKPGHTCGSWAGLASDGGALVGYGGLLEATTQLWTGQFTGNCSHERRLYCLGTSYSNHLVKPAAMGLRAFVSRTTFSPADGGMARADSLCGQEAALAGLTGTFKALLATEKASAASRFTPSWQPYVRPDGVVVVDQSTGLFGAGMLRAPINVHASGSGYAGNLPVWTGSTALAEQPDGGTCESWDSHDGALHGQTGLAAVTNRRAFTGLPASCGSNDRGVYCLEERTANRAFVTSTQHVPSTIGSLAAADAICNARSAAAGLPGAYVAWLSDENTDARDRLGTARGWVRTDGRPFADSVAALTSGQIFHPPILDEYGRAVGPHYDVVTATGMDGTRRPGLTCGNWNGSLLDGGGLFTTGGHARAGSGAWTDHWQDSCGVAKRLYCLGRDHRNPVQPAARPGRLAFTTRSAFEPSLSGGLASADALCQSEARAAGLTGAFRALLATAGNSAASRFNLDGPTWVRPDGIALTERAADLFQAPFLSAPISLHADGTYLAASRPNWTGRAARGRLDGGASCQGWTSNGSGASGRIGSPRFTHYYWYSAGASSCDNLQTGLYCLEE